MEGSAAIADESRMADPGEVLYNTELGRAILTAINTLSEEHRAVVMLCDVEGFSYSEIAQILELSEGTVKSRLFRARERLRTKLSGIV